MRNGEMNSLSLKSANVRVRTLAIASALSIMVALPVAVFATPGHGDTASAVAIAQNVDYIGGEAGSRLDLDFPVLVPSFVPGPFGGSPAIDSGNGYYSLYWMNPGGEPTFLQVTGQVGGALPAGSPYDLNVQLFINSSVGGNGAIHDVTPAYDTVWWIAGGVLYKVESRNSGADSVSIANSLIAFVPPVVAEPEPEPTEPPVVEEPEEPRPEPEDPVQEPDPVVTEPGSDVDDPTAEPEPIADPSDADPGDDAAETDGETLVDQAAEVAVTAEDVATATQADDAAATEDEPLQTSDGTGETAYSSDGTGGAQNLVVVGDGTGGTIEVIVPRRPSGQPTP